VTGENERVLIGSLIRDMPVLADKKVLYYGEPVAIAVADEEWQAALAVQKIRVKFKPLTVLLSPSLAVSNGAPILHEDLGQYQKIVEEIFPEPGTNIVNRLKIRKGDMEKGWQQSAERLVTMGELRRGRGERYLTRSGDFVAGRIALRSASANSVAVVDASSGEMLGNVEAERAFSTVHPGAIYLHLGRSYEVAELDTASRRAIVKPFEGDYYTQVKKETEVYIERVQTQRRTLGVELNFGAVSVSEQVIAYQRKRLGDNKVIDIVSLDLPEQDFVTQALWYVIGDRMAAALPSEVLLGALHASEHGQIAVLPLIAMCDRWDIGGLSTNIHHQTNEPTVFVYDGHAGGVGITERGFDCFEGWVEDTARMLEGCPCSDGCPSCVQSPKCGNLNEMLDKEGALTFLRRLVAAAA
jgi:DEAD/DEAH box helicase domain-containing protein